MHRVIESHLDSFVDDFALNLDQEKAFEAFIAYVLVRQHHFDKLEPLDLIYEGDDPGIDGVLFFIDFEFVNSVDEIKQIFSNSKRNSQVLIFFYAVHHF